MDEQVPKKWLEWTSLLLGLAITYCVFAYTERPFIAWNAGAVGTVVVCCSVVAICHYRTFAEWINFVLGCWIVVTPYALAFETQFTVTLVHVVLGSCISVNAAAQLICEKRTRRRCGGSSSRVKFD
ncbi:SPW repeat domain-containing protein [Brucella cytisi]|uniref:SPW repeat domain-containing protein n=1 Tax=Brucella cytisi TaxID=407152 RepID=UPI000A715C82